MREQWDMLSRSSLLLGLLDQAVQPEPVVIIASSPSATAAAIPAAAALAAVHSVFFPLELHRPRARQDRLWFATAVSCTRERRLAQISELTLVLLHPFLVEFVDA